MAAARGGVGELVNLTTAKRLVEMENFVFSSTSLLTVVNFSGATEKDIDCTPPHVGLPHGDDVERYL